MNTRIVALLNDEESADSAAKALDGLQIDDLEWRFITTSSSDFRLMPGIPGRATTADTGMHMGFIQETDPPPEFPLKDLNLSREDETFFAKGLERDELVIVVDTPDDYVEQVEQVLAAHNAERPIET
jgi:hypothetical protein